MKVSAELSWQITYYMLITLKICGYILSELWYKPKFTHLIYFLG